MSWATEPLELSSGRVSVRTLSSDYIDRIIEAIHDPKGWSGRMWGIDTHEKICDMLHRQIKEHEKGECHPFVYFVDGSVAGITRYHSIFPGRKALEIGGTCVAPKWRRTFVNTDVKKILLTYAFEKLDVVRVELRVDCLNYTSQMNVLRLGASFEGKIRHWQIRGNGDLPDGMLYSITNKEWPVVKSRLTALQNHERPGTPFLPWELKSKNLRMNVYKLSDSTDFFDLVVRNRKSLLESFPHSASFETLEQVHSFIAEKVHLASSGSAFYYVVRDSSNNKMIGQLQIKLINWKLRSAELGYFIDEEYRRQGLTSQMVDVALNELFTRHNFNRITLRCITTNEASIKLAEKFSFQKEVDCGRIPRGLVALVPI